MAIPGERFPNTFFRSAAGSVGVAGARGGGLGAAGTPGDDGEEVPVLPVEGVGFAGADGFVGCVASVGADGAAVGSVEERPADARTSFMYCLAWSGVKTSFTLFPRPKSPTIFVVI